MSVVASEIIVAGLMQSWGSHVLYNVFYSGSPKKDFKIRASGKHCHGIEAYLWRFAVEFSWPLRLQGGLLSSWVSAIELRAQLPVAVAITWEQRCVPILAGCGNCTASAPYS